MGFTSRSRALREGAKLLADLARMPDRAAAKDFSVAAGLMIDAANDLDELIKASPVGCICRRIENDNYSYVDYAESCQHHGQLYALSARLKADYAKAEKALKDEMRLRLVTAALAGTAANSVQGRSSLVERALFIADEVLRQLVEEPK